MAPTLALQKLILSRLPRSGDIWPVYASVSFMFHAWTLLVFFWELRAWAYFLTWSELTAVLAYAMAVSEVEGLLSVTLLLGVCAVLPGRMLAEAFAVRGTLIAAAVIGSLMFCLLHYGPSDSLSLRLMLGWLSVGIILGAALAYLSAKFGYFSSAIAWSSDQMLVFLIIWIPLSIISFAVIIWRNVF